MNRSAEYRTGRAWLRTGAMLLVGAAGAPTAAHSQDAAPQLPFGSVVVLMPVQSALPSPGGAWPGKTTSEEDAVKAMEAELEFALAERRAAADWALPDDLRRRVGRNPTLKVNPDRVAYQGLLSRPDRREQIYEPLHGELRVLAALFGTRFVVLPLVLRTAPPGTDAQAETAAGEPASTEPCADGAGQRRAELLLTVIDIRRSSILWYGTVRSAPGCPEAGGLLADLAARVSHQLTDS